MKFTDKVNVLGVEYEIIVEKSDLTPKLRDANGYIEINSKKIVLHDWPEDLTTVERPELSKSKTLRHEIIHAFFAECGLDRYMRDETLVSSLSVLIPKMVEAFRLAGAGDSA